jgi:hypothetical protein
MKAGKTAGMKAEMTAGVGAKKNPAGAGSNVPALFRARSPAKQA